MCRGAVEVRGVGSPGDGVTGSYRFWDLKNQGSLKKTITTEPSLQPSAPLRQGLLFSPASLTSSSPVLGGIGA